MSMNKKKLTTKKKRSALFKKILVNKYLYIMLIPAIIYYAIFHYYPMYGVLVAFKDYNFTDGILGSSWAGLSHFKYLFDLDKFWQVFWNTIVISVYRLIFGFPFPIFIALLLNE